MTNFTQAATIAFTVAFLPVFAAPAFSADMMKHDAPVKEAAMMKHDDMMKSESSAKEAAMMKDHSFAEKAFKIRGDYSIVTENGQTLLRLSDDFKTNNGPDLKVFLSPQSPETVTGRSATSGAVLLGALKTNKGGSDYVIPAGVNLAGFQSVLIHCEAYSKLWGAAQL